MFFQSQKNRKLNLIPYVAPGHLSFAEIRIQRNQLQPSAVHTPAAVPLAPDTLRSTNSPAPTVTLPVAVQAAPDAAEHVRAVSAILPGVPIRSITVMLFDCREKTLNCVAAHPAGTHVSTESVSVAAAFALFTE